MEGQPTHLMVPTDRHDPPNYRLSILDRLLGVAEGRARPRVAGRVANPREERIRRQIESDPTRGRREIGILDWIIAGVKEDLRCLLNATRANAFENVGPHDPLHQSLWTYGLLDMSDQTATDVAAGNLLSDAIRDTITRFEPRLRDVEVVTEASDPSDLFVRMRIKARLLVDPGGAEPVTFDTFMRLDSRQIDVTGGLDGG